MKFAKVPMNGDKGIIEETLLILSYKDMSGIASRIEAP